MSLEKEIKVRDEELKEILATPVAKVEHRWSVRLFNNKPVTVLQQRKFTFKEAELRVGRWQPTLTGIVSVKAV